MQKVANLTFVLNEMSMAGDATEQKQIHAGNICTTGCIKCSHFANYIESVHHYLFNIIHSILLNSLFYKDPKQERVQPKYVNSYGPIITVLWECVGSDKYPISCHSTKQRTKWLGKEKLRDNINTKLLLKYLQTMK